MEEVINNAMTEEDQLREDLIYEQAIVNRNSKVINDLVNTIVDKFCERLDNVVGSIEADLSGPVFNIVNEVLYTYLVKLPIELYYCSSELERQGIKEDLSKILKTEAYNKAFQGAEGTVALRASFAEDTSKKQTLICTINSRAYKKIKSRIEYATDLASALKKILSSRITEREVFNQHGNQT